MKKIILVFLLFSSSVFAERTISYTRPFTTTETVLVCGGSNYQCEGLRYHMITWALREGTMTDCHVKSQYALIDGGTKSDLNTVQDCSAGGASIVVVGFYPYIYLTTTHFTKDAGSPVVDVTYAGWQDNPFGISDSTSTSTTTSTTTTSTSTTTSTAAPTTTTTL
jgi:hypothetical protein